jgi:hypothetical protein
MTAVITETPVVGNPGDIHTTAIHGAAQNLVGTRARGKDTTGNTAEYIYLKGVTSTIVGSVVTFDEAGTTTLIAANAKGPVAVATAVCDAATSWAWYGIQGTFLTDVVANSADNSTIGRETTDGKVGDGRAAGDQIANAFQRAATTTAAVVLCQFDHSFVDDFLGA